MSLIASCTLYNLLIGKLDQTFSAGFSSRSILNTVENWSLTDFIQPTTCKLQDKKKQYSCQPNNGYDNYVKLIQILQ